MSTDTNPALPGWAQSPLYERVIGDEVETRQHGSRLGEKLRAGDFVGLVGNLGAGKTTFIQGLVRSTVDAQATSPTYTLVNTYEGPTAVHHFDLYRLDGVNELETVGYWDYVEDDTAISVVEWIDRVPEAWPRSSRCWLVHLQHSEDGRRMRLFVNDREINDF